MPGVECRVLTPLRHPFEAHPELLRLPLQAHYVCMPPGEGPGQEPLPHFMQAALQDAPVTHLLLVSHPPLRPKHHLCSKVHPHGSIGFTAVQKGEASGLQLPPALARREACSPPVPTRCSIERSLVCGECHPLVEHIPPRVTHPEPESLQVGLPEVSHNMNPPEEP